jgi:hypothetical protein
MDGPAVVAAYRDLYQVERSFRMTKSDLAARPVFHRLEDSIQAHLTIVFAALAVSREAQTRAGLSINRILKILRPLRSATVTIGAQQVTAQPRITAEARTPPQRPRLEWSQNRYNSGQMGQDRGRDRPPYAGAPVVVPVTVAFGGGRTERSLDCGIENTDRHLIQLGRLCERFPRPSPSPSVR